MAESRITRFIKKPSIPTLTGWPDALIPVMRPIRETLEIITGRRGQRIPQLNGTVSPDVLALRINEIIRVLQDGQDVEATVLLEIPTPDVGAILSITGVLPIQVSAGREPVVSFNVPVGRVVLQGGGLDLSEVGYRAIPGTERTGSYTTVAGDAGKSIIHPSSDPAALNITLASNATVPYPLGSAISFFNRNGAGDLVINAGGTDVVRRGGTGAVGPHTLLANGVCTAVKVATTEWMIAGTGIA